MVRNNGRNIWIGMLSSTMDNTFHWIDGSRLTFSYWEPGEPNNWGDDEDKVEIQWYNDAQFATKGEKMKPIFYDSLFLVYKKILICHNAG